MSGYNSYPYYQGYGATPNYTQRQYAAQPPQMMPTQPQMPLQPSMDSPIQDIKFVNRAQADAYIVFPNTKVMLIDNESGMVYVKTADYMGQSKTDYYRFSPVNADGSPLKPQEEPPTVNFDDFVRKEQIPSLGFVTYEEYGKLISELDEIKKALSSSKQPQKSETQKGGN